MAINGTQHDLSFDLVEIDYQELIRTANIAVGRSKDELQRILNKWYNLPNEKQPTSTDAQQLVHMAEQVSQSTTTLYVLREGLTRSTLTIKNKPNES